MQQRYGWPTRAGRGLWSSNPMTKRLFRSGQRVAVELVSRHHHHRYVEHPKHLRRRRPEEQPLGRAEPARPDHDQVTVAPVELADRVLDRWSVDDRRRHRNALGQGVFRGLQRVPGMFERALADGLRINGKFTVTAVKRNERWKTERRPCRLTEPNRRAQQQIHTLALT